MNFAKTCYWVLSALSAGSLLLAINIWLNLMFGPDQGLGGVGSAIATMIFFSFAVIAAIGDFFVGKYIFRKAGDKKYREIAAGFLILLSLLLVLEFIIRSMV